MNTSAVDPGPPDAAQALWALRDLTEAKDARGVAPFKAKIEVEVPQVAPDLYALDGALVRCLRREDGSLAS